MWWFFLGLIGCALLTGKPEARELDLSYEIYFGGFSVASFNTKITVDRSAYRVTANARSLGILEFFFPIEVTGEGTGLVTGTEVKPLQYLSKGTFDGQPRHVTLTNPGSARTRKMP